MWRNEAVVSKTQIKSLDEVLMNGSIRSNRMFLWQNPSASLSLKPHLKLRTLNFSDQRILDLLRVIEETTGVEKKEIKRGDLRFLDIVFDVMLPEIFIQIQEEDNITRFMAEVRMASGSRF